MECKWNFYANSKIYQNEVLNTNIGSYHVVPESLFKDLFLIFANLLRGKSKNIDIIILIKSYFKFLNLLNESISFRFKWFSR